MLSYGFTFCFLRYTILCHAKLCYVVFYYVTLFYAILCYVALCYIMLLCVITGDQGWCHRGLGGLVPQLLTRINFLIRPNSITKCLGEGEGPQARF